MHLENHPFLWLVLNDKGAPQLSLTVKLTRQQ